LETEWKLHRLLNSDRNGNLAFIEITWLLIMFFAFGHIWTSVRIPFRKN